MDASLRGREKQHDEKLKFHVPEQLRPFAQAVAARLSLGAGVMDITVCDDQIFVSQEASGTQLTARHILHALYREKIYQETLPARLSLFHALDLP